MPVPSLSLLLHLSSLSLLLHLPSSFSLLKPNSVQATAELAGISVQQAAMQVQEVLGSLTGLMGNGELFEPINVCPSKTVSSSSRLFSSSSSCSLQQFIPIGPAGFPSGGTIESFSCSDTCKFCNPCSKFRTADGTCNNLGTHLLSFSAICPTNWGSTNQAFRRLTPNRYADGREKPTVVSRTAREVSNYVHAHSNPPLGTGHTLLVMQLGQFLDHDITFTPEVVVENCCNANGSFPTGPLPSNCFPLPIPASDPAFPPTITCRQFTRSAPRCDKSSSIHAREQFNGLTAYLDTSQVYGSQTELASSLRAHHKGRLRVSGDNLLPLARTSGGYGGSDSGSLGNQFEAGDVRVTENPGLQGLHTVFLREHNRVAGVIAAMGNGWDDERIYQEAKRIVTAEWQNVVFGEWLPEVLGPDAPVHTTNTAYDSTEDATVFNVFATAAFRFGHSLIQGKVNIHPSGSYQLKENFGDISLINSGGKLNGILKGNSGQELPASDKFIHNQVRNGLFANLAPHGSDLAARNIQRGRDHGLGSYKDYREGVCGLPAPTGADWAALANFYGGYSDIEIFPGGLMEKPLPGRLVGPTFSCLLAKQFSSLQKGDRFFFTHQKYSCCKYNCQRFTTAQQRHLMTRTLRDILCENTDIANLQSKVLKSVSGSNPLMSCSNTNTLDVASLLTPTHCIWFPCF